MIPLAPDAVRVEKVGLGPFERRLWISLILLTPVFAGIWAMSDPANRTTDNMIRSLVGLPLYYLFLGTFLTITTWIEPTDGTIANRYYGRFVSRAHLGPDTRILLTRFVFTGSTQLFLEAHSSHRRPIRIVIAFVESPYASTLDVPRLHVLADLLATRVPDTTQDLVALLRAQADHLTAGHPTLTSPLVEHIDSPTVIPFMGPRP